MDNEMLIQRCKLLEDHTLLYEICIEKFWSQKNECHRKQIPYPIRTLKTILNSISIKFSPNLENIYFIDIKILFAREDLSPLGHYRWVTTNENEFIDDFFVIY